MARKAGAMSRVRGASSSGSTTWHILQASRAKVWPVAISPSCAAALKPVAARAQASVAARPSRGIITRPRFWPRAVDRRFHSSSNTGALWGPSRAQGYRFRGNTPCVGTVNPVGKRTMIARHPFAINTKEGCRAGYPSRQLGAHNNRLHASTTCGECRNDRISRCSMAHQQWNGSVREEMPRHTAEKALS